MPTPAYDQGKAQQAEGLAFDANPYDEATAADGYEDWANGWQDAAATASGSSPGEPGTAAPAGTPNAEGDNDAATEEEAAPMAVEVVDALGEAGYDRIMDLLSNPPLDDEDMPLPGFPGEEGVPDDLGEWLMAWKQPLAFVAVDTAINVMKHKIGGSDKGRLKELYRGMAPDAMVAAMNANADAVSRFGDERVAEAGLIASMQAKVTQKAASYLLTALMLV